MARPHRRSRSPRNSRGKKLLNIKAFFYSATAVALVGGIAIANVLKPEQTPVSSELCFEGAGDNAETIVFVDASQPRWDKSQKRGVINRLEEIIASLDVGERITFLTTWGDELASVPRPRLSMCRPPKTVHERDIAGISLTATNAYLKNIYEKEFESPITAAILEIFDVSESETANDPGHSPILEYITAITRMPGFNEGNTKLVIISDFIQNSEAGHFCLVQGDMPPFALYRETERYKRAAPRSLSGIDIELLILLRPGIGEPVPGTNEILFPYCSGEGEIWRFWRDLFEGNDAASVDRVRIRYDG